VSTIHLREESQTMRHSILILAPVFALVAVCLFNGCHTRPPVETPPGALAAEAALTPAPDAGLPVDPAVEIGVLPSGLTYYVRENRRPEARASLFLVVAAGSIDEDDDQRGLAHMAEHMAFNGTEHFPKHALVDFLESIGMAFGPDVNAFTGFDQTVYMLQVPTDDEELLDTGLRILENWAHRVSFEEEEIDLERGVIVEEWRVGLSAGRRIWDRQLPIIFRGSKYAERSVIGDMDIVRNHEYDTIRRYYRDWYRPDLQAVVAVGDFDGQEMIAKIHEAFAELRGPDEPRPHAQEPVPHHAETLVSVVTDPEATRTEVGLIWKSAPAGLETAGDFRHRLAVNLGSDMLQARFQELANQVDPPFTSASAGYGQMTRTISRFGLNANTPEGGAGRGLEVLAAEAERMRRHGFTDGELERARQRTLRSLERQVEERETTNSRSWSFQYMRHFLNGGALMDAGDRLRLTELLLPQIDASEVEAAILALMTGHNHVITVSGPERAELAYPTEAEVAAMIAAAGAQPIEPYVDEAVEAPLVAAAPPLADIVSREEDPELGTTVWTLANGIRVVVKPTGFRSDEILMQAYQWGGTSIIDDPEARRLAGTAARGVSQSGAGAFDPVALQKALTGKVASVWPEAGGMTSGWQGNASPRDLETMLQLIWLQATEPREDPDAFTSWLQRTRVWYQGRDADPMNALRDTVQVLLYDRNPVARPFTIEDIDRIDLSSGMTFFRQMTADLGGMTFFFVGNIDLDQLEPLVRSYLGNLPAAGREHRWFDRHVPTASGLRSATVRQGLDPKGYVQIVLTGETEWSPEAAYAMESLIASLRIRLRQVVREDMSGTYGVGIRGRLQRIPRETFRVDIGWGCDPERVEELTAAVRGALEEFVATGPDDETLDKVRETQLRNDETNLKENRYWLNQLANNDRNGLDPRRILRRADQVATLSNELVRDAAARYLNAGNEVRVVLLPEDWVSF